MVLSCMDPRFQHLVHNHLKKKKLTGKYSAFTIAGAAVGVTHNKFNRKDCGAPKIAYGKENLSQLMKKKFIKIRYLKLKNK